MSTFPSMSSPNYVGAAAKSMLQRAANRPKAPPASANRLVVRGGRVMADADEDTWKPTAAKQKSAPPSKAGSQHGGEASPVRPDLVLTRDRLSTKCLLERELQTNDFIEKLRREAEEAGGDDDGAWSVIGSDAGGGFGGGGAPRSKQRLRAIFDAFDYDGSGAIDVHELGKILQEMKIEKTPPEVAALLAEADADGNGAIDFDEFVAIFSTPTSGLASVFAASGQFGASGLFSFLGGWGGSGGAGSSSGGAGRAGLGGGGRAAAGGEFRGGRGGTGNNGQDSNGGAPTLMAGRCFGSAPSLPSSSSASQQAQIGTRGATGLRSAPGSRSGKLQPGAARGTKAAKNGEATLKDESGQPLLQSSKEGDGESRCACIIL